MSDTSKTLQFIDAYQTGANAGTYEVEVTLTVPEALRGHNLKENGEKKILLHVAGPRFSLPPSTIHSVFPPENGAGDYNNVLPHIVLNRHTLPWERLADSEREEVPFLALLVFTEDEERSGQVTPPTTITLEKLGYQYSSTASSTETQRLEPGEKLSDKVSIIDVNPDLLRQILPTPDDLTLLAHGRVLTGPAESDNTEGKTENQGIKHQRAVVIANRLPEPPLHSTTNLDQKTQKNSSTNLSRRHIAHLVMLENRYDAGQFNFGPNPTAPVRLVCLKSWQFFCSKDKPTLESRLINNPDFSFDTFRVHHWSKSSSEAQEETPKDAQEETQEKISKDFVTLHNLSYTALPYHLRWGDRTHTLYHGPLVANVTESERLGSFVPTSAEALTRLLKLTRRGQADDDDNIEDHIFDVSLAAAWQLGQLMLLRDQNIAMDYFRWRRTAVQYRARQANWQTDRHLQWEDQTPTHDQPLPQSVSDWFADRLALREVPFEYLVPDINMLPPHTLRMFRLDPIWMDCFISGALSLGRGSETDRKQEANYRKQFFPTEAPPYTGFLFRSPAVDENPDLQVTAFGQAPEGTAEDVPLAVIRLDRLGSNLLFGLFTGTIAKLEFSLPPIGLHFGLSEVDSEVGNVFTKDVKNPDNPKNKLGHIPAAKSHNSNTTSNASTTDQKVVKDQRVVNISYLAQEMATIINNPKNEEATLKTQDSSQQEQESLPQITSGSFALQMVEGTEMVVFETGKGA